jgi:hypothetical protein
MHEGPISRTALDGEECRRRLGEAELARVLISVRCLPAALPVRLAVADGDVAFASVEAAVIEAARRGDVLAVQVDGTDDDGTWSVQVTGASRLGQPSEISGRAGARAAADAVRAGASLVVVPLTVVSGERISWRTRR